MERPESPPHGHGCEWEWDGIGVHAPGGPSELAGCGCGSNAPPSLTPAAAAGRAGLGCECRLGGAAPSSRTLSRLCTQFTRPSSARLTTHKPPTKVSQPHTIKVVNNGSRRQPPQIVKANHRHVGSSQMAATKADRDERGCIRSPNQHAESGKRLSQGVRGRRTRRRRGPRSRPPRAAALPAPGSHPRPLRAPPAQSYRADTWQKQPAAVRGTKPRMMQQPPETERGCLNLAVGSGLGDGGASAGLGLGWSGHYKWRLGSGLGWVMVAVDQG